VSTYTYDQWERVRTMTDPVGTWTTGYETKRGYPDTLLTPLGDSLTYVHDEQGRAVGPYIRSGGLLQWTELGWNVNQSLDSVGTMTAGVAGNFISGRYVRPNPTDDGYIALEPVWVEQHGMGAPIDSLRDVVAYDGWERLTSWTAKKNAVTVLSETYSFDRTGNISQPTGAATYNVVTDRLMSRVEAGGNRTFVYDRAGNLVQQTKLSTGEVRDFGYDALNQLVSVRQGGVLMARYAYDVLGRRIAKRVYSSASDGVPGYTRFVYHGDQVAFQSDSAGVMGLRFTWGLGTDDLRAATDGAGQHYYIVQDKLGSVRGLVQRDGTWRASASFNPYGDLVAIDSSSAKPPIWYAWTGREFDEETGWYYHRARYYSPLIRRFVQEDPIGYGGGTNLYAYVEGQALEASDPSGMIICNERRCGAGGGLPPGKLAPCGAACPSGGDMGGNVSSSDMLSAVFGSASNGVAIATKPRPGSGCRGNCTQSNAGAVKSTGGRVFVVGFGANLGGPMGPTRAKGLYADANGVGVFSSSGVELGLSCCASGFLGTSTSAGALGGRSSGYCLSLAVVVGCRYTNEHGTTYILGGSLGPKVGFHYEQNDTKLNRQRPIPRLPYPQRDL
jgi:RHS repeat-associated protein